MENNIVPKTNQKIIDVTIRSIDEIQSLAKLFVESGMFQDTKSIAQAVVKIMAGNELGIGPFLAMEGIDIIAGRVALSPLLLSAIMKSQNKYNYKVLKSNESICEIAFFEKGMHIGNSVFSIEEAKRMELVNKDNWRKQPKMMLFWRCLSRGIRMYCPDLYNGIKVYTTEELDPNRNIVDVDLATTPEVEETPTENIEYASQEEIILEPTHYLDQIQLRKLQAIASSKGIKKEDFNQILKQKYGDRVPETAYNEIMEYLKGVENGQ